MKNEINAMVSQNERLEKEHKELQDKIRRMNKQPVAELFHEAINLESYYYYRCGDHSNDIWYKIKKVVSV